MGHVSVIEGAGFVELHLDRAEKKNALTSAMYRELTDALSRAGRSADVRAVLIAGAGQAFCAGNDLGDFLNAPGGTDALDFLLALVTFPKPIVAAVQGPAVGIGTTMLFHCDLVYAAPDASFIMPFVRLGLVPEGGSSLAAPALLGPARAARMLLLGEPMGAREAAAAGLVSEVVDAALLLDHARGKVAALLDLPPHALAATRGILRGDPAAMLARIDAEAALFAAALRSPEAKVVIAAFLGRITSASGREDAARPGPG
jgi:enoyl-CoA hydratase/carnithine racemase